MKPFSNRRSKHCTVFVVLVLWMFGLATGVANACLTQTSHPAASLSHSHSTGNSEHEGTHHSKTPCEKFCSDQSNLLIKQQSSVDQPNPGAAPLIIVLWNVIAPLQSVSMWIEREPPMASALPLRLRYTRLSL